MLTVDRMSCTAIRVKPTVYVEKLEDVKLQGSIQ